MLLQVEIAYCSLPPGASRDEKKNVYFLMCAGGFKGRLRICEGFLGMAWQVAHISID
jgi:hypothetical protein